MIEVYEPAQLAASPTSWVCHGYVRIGGYEEFVTEQVHGREYPLDNKTRDSMLLAVMLRLTEIGADAYERTYLAAEAEDN